MSLSNIEPERSVDICKAFGNKQVKQLDSKNLCKGFDELVDLISINQGKSTGPNDPSHRNVLQKITGFDSCRLHRNYTENSKGLNKY